MGKFRVEVPVWGEKGLYGGFQTRQYATEAATKMASELKVLVLVWDFAAAMYVERIDGRVAA
jgi:hypothetical protein